MFSNYNAFARRCWHTRTRNELAIVYPQRTWVSDVSWCKYALVSVLPRRIQNEKNMFAGPYYWLSFEPIPFRSLSLTMPVLLQVDGRIVNKVCVFFQNIHCINAIRLIFRKNAIQLVGISTRKSTKGFNNGISISMTCLWNNRNDVFSLLKLDNALGNFAPFNWLFLLFQLLPIFYLWLHSTFPPSILYILGITERAICLILTGEIFGSRELINSLRKPN